ncbi:MAG: hypothetical protein SGILL_000521 [Bacillariaceae sp.]
MNAEVFSSFAAQPGSTSTSWFNATLWTEHLSVPQSLDVVRLDSSGALCTIDDHFGQTEAAEAMDVTIAQSGSNVQLDLERDGPGLMIGNDLVIGQNSGSSGSVHSQAVLTVGRNMVVGDQGSGSFDLLGGSVNVDGSLSIGSNGEFFLTAGRLTAGSINMQTDTSRFEMNPGTNFAVVGDHLDSVLDSVVSNKLVPAAMDSVVYGILDVTESTTNVYASGESSSAPSLAPSTSLSPTVTKSLTAPNVASMMVNRSIAFSGCNAIAITSGELESGDTLVVSVTDGVLSLTTTDGITLNTLSSGSSIVFSSGSTEDINTAMDGMTLTSSSPGRHDFLVAFVRGGESYLEETFKVAVNQEFDVEQARTDIAFNVTEMHSGVQPGRMVVFGPTAQKIIMYPGTPETEGPMVSAATLGNGRVIGVPDHQMLQMMSYGDSSGQFYRNGIRWLTKGAVADEDVRILTYDQGVADWLIGQGFAKVAKFNSESSLMAALSDADVFVGWMGSRESNESLEALRQFCSDGGGLFIAEYGVGYDWWWGKEYPDAPGNLLLREAGIGFMGGNRWDTGTLDATNVAPANSQISAYDVLDMLKDSSGFSDEQLTEGGYVMNGLYEALPIGDHLRCDLDSYYNERIKSINPTPTNRVTDGFDKALLNRETKVLVSTPPEEVTKHRNVEDVYGVVPDAANRVTQTVEIDTSRGRWHPTGLYAAPGELISVTVPAEMVDQGFRIRINAHTDNIGKRDSWERPPYVHRWYGISSTTFNVANAFGGAIFVDLGGNARSTPPNLGTMPVTISNAVEHPYFVLGKHNDDDWVTSLRDKPAPYAVFVCEDLIIVQRSEESASLTEPTRLMEWWQKVVDLQDEMAAYDEDGVPSRTSAEIINTDIQNSAGAAHSGYPIQAYDRYWGNLANVDYLIERGSWGDFHELGHNHQQGWWTFPEDGETTVNIFSAYCQRQLVAENPGSWTWTATPIGAMKRAIDALESRASGATNYKDVSSVGYRLAFWIQLADGFGWGTMKEQFKKYELLKLADNDALPSGEQEEKDQWLIRFSNTTRHDLREFMVGTWGLEVSGTALNATRDLDLPTWMPAMGGLESLSVKYGKNVTFDLRGEALSLDGVAVVDINTEQPGLNGVLIENEDSSFTYTPFSGFAGTFSFSYDGKLASTNTKGLEN